MAITQYLEAETMRSKSLLIREYAENHRKTCCVLIGATIVLSWRPADAETDFGVDINLGIIRSDNIFLAADGEEQSETVYTIAPEFYITSDDERFQADIRYQPQARVLFRVRRI